MKRVRECKMSAIKSILEHEGFVAKPYADPIHGWEVPTFGHGLTYITEEESKRIVANRVVGLDQELSRKLPYYRSLPDDVQDVLVEMAYQIGVSGLLKFAKMLAKLEQGEYVQAAQEGLDSRWAKQTPGRAKELMKRVAEV